MKKLKKPIPAIYSLSVDEAFPEESPIKEYLRTDDQG